MDKAVAEALAFVDIYCQPDSGGEVDTRYFAAKLAAECRRLQDELERQRGLHDAYVAAAARHQPPAAVPAGWKLVCAKHGDLPLAGCQFCHSPQPTQEAVGDREAFKRGFEAAQRWDATPQGLEYAMQHELYEKQIVPEPSQRRAVAADQRDALLLEARNCIEKVAWSGSELARETVARIDAALSATSTTKEPKP